MHSTGSFQPLHYSSTDNSSETPVISEEIRLEHEGGLVSSAILAAAARGASESELGEILSKAINAILSEREKGEISSGRVAGQVVELRHAKNIAIISDLHGD